jgi:hypothetical protein
MKAHRDNNGISNGLNLVRLRRNRNRINPFRVILSCCCRMQNKLVRNRNGINSLPPAFQPTNEEQSCVAATAEPDRSCGAH